MRTNRTWQTPLDIPAASAGNGWAVEHDHRPAGTVLSTASMRSAILGGEHGEMVRFDEPTRWHRLVDPGDTLWMTDLPVEQAQHDALLRPVTWGRTVLVGGLGLGLAATMLAPRKKVRRVIVVERQREVIDLVWPHTLLDDPVARAKVEVVHADVADYLRERAERKWEFDWAFLDTWAGDGLTTFFEEVLPLRALTVGVVRSDRVLCWAENVMRGQLMMHLYGGMTAVAPEWEDAFARRLRFEPPKPGDVPTRWNWDAAFWQWVATHGDRERASRMVPTYCRTVGMMQHDAAWASAVEDERRRVA